MLASTSAPFDDAAWIFEIKWDGVRAMASIENDTWRLWGKEGTDYTDRYPELESLRRRLPAGTMLDGELVMLRQGLPDIHPLMARHRLRTRRTPFFVEAARYIVFDLLFYRGRSLMKQPLAERRQLLPARLAGIPYASLCEGVVGAGRSSFEAAIAAGHEGVVAKRLASPYVPKQRGGAWQKIKQKSELPCVVIGYRSGANGLRDLLMGSLIDGKLVYVGAVDLGIREPAKLLKRLRTMNSTAPVVPCWLSAKWLKPELYCRVHFCGRRPGAWRDPVIAAWDE
jgi:bifunctional non-homologous end joining protein LigD